MSRSSQANLRSRPSSGVGRSRPSTGHTNKGMSHDDMPSAMESEQYVDGRISVGHESPRYDGDLIDTSQDNSGCWGKFKVGLRSVWSTRHTEDTTEDKELYIKTTIRELVIYILFLIVLLLLTFLMTSGTMYYYTKVMSDLFTESALDGSDSNKGTFRTVGTIEDFWKFAKVPLMSGLYWDKWYNNMNVSAEERNFIYFENKLLGVPRVRQLKVKSDSCDIAKDFQADIKQCYAMYDPSVEDKEPFGPMNSTAWNYTETKILDHRDSEGHMAYYSGGGYYIDLKRNKEGSLAIIEDLFKNLWITRGTRAVMIDFTVYNANINLFCYIKLIFEFPATGGAMTKSEFRTVKLLRYVSPRDFFVLACECLFLGFILYYIIEEVIEIKKHKLSYFTSFWNWLDVIVILISLICSIFNVYRTMSVGSKLKDLLGDNDTFPDFDFLSYWQLQFNNAIAMTVFAAMVKIFKYISFNKTMTQLSTTLGACAKDLAGFAVMFFIIFFAFAQLGYLIFGTQVRDFRAFSHAIFTLFRIILGDFDFAGLEAAHRILGPVYFMAYVFFVFFVLINMFLAIINDTYSEVKGDLANQPNEFEMGDYFKKRANVVMDKLNFKRDKIVDIQKAITAADINGDKQLDFDEWRNELKNRGYADCEIEAVFAKYDLDGDRILDQSEQLKMQNELDGQKATLNDEIQRERDEADEDEDGRPIVRGGVSNEEFNVLSKRVDRMESSIGNIVGKIDNVLIKLEEMEVTKLKRRETMGKILDSITTDDDLSEERKREKMEDLVRDELSKWEGESSRAMSRNESGSRLQY